MADEKDQDKNQGEKETKQTEPTKGAPPAPTETQFTTGGSVGAKAKGNVRIYTVLDSMIHLNLDPNPFLNADTVRYRGNEVASTDFKPASLEQRYLDTKAIELKETTTQADWAQRLKKSAKG